jgi:hypothetical protein
MTNSRSPSSFLLAFPLGNDPKEYPGKITFEQIKITSLTAGRLFALGEQIVVDKETNEKISFDSRAQGIGTGANELTGLDQLAETNRGAIDVATTTNKAVALQTVKRTPRAGNTATSPDTPKIQLYLPPNINFRDGISYSDTTNLGAIGASVQGSVESGSSLGKAAFDAFKTSSKGLIDGMVDGMKDEAGAVAAVRVANRFSSFEKTNAALGAATRVAMNPNVRTQFQSVPVRSFAFQFKMIPNSATEVKQIEAIIKRFRTVMYPDEIGADAISLGYRFPDPFEIKMFYNNSEVFTRILPSYLRDINVTYNTSGMGFHEDGGFTDVDVSLTFTESRPLNKDDVVRGGY